MSRPSAYPVVSGATATPNGSTFALTWGANASVAGLHHYDVDVSTDNRATWSPVVANTQATSASYTAQQGHSYVFRVVVTDNAGRTAQAETSAQGKRVTKYYAMGTKRVAMRADSVVYYLHADHLSSTSLVTCGSSGGCNGTPYQGVASRQWYDPYGSVRASVGTLPTDFTFTGQRADATGLMYFRARYYSSSLGRFVSADTVVPSPGNPQSLNRYAYTQNNPLKFIDPTGHHEECNYGDGCGQEGQWLPEPPPQPDPLMQVIEELDNLAWNLPSTVGLHWKVVSAGVDLFAGANGYPADTALVFNWRSGEVGLLHTWGVEAQGGTPNLVSLQSELGGVAYWGASRIRYVSGPSVHGGGELTADAWGKAGLSATAFAIGIDSNIETLRLSQLKRGEYYSRFFVDP